MIFIAKWLVRGSNSWRGLNIKFVGVVVGACCREFLSALGVVACCRDLSPLWACRLCLDFGLVYNKISCVGCLLQRPFLRSGHVGCA